MKLRSVFRPFLGFLLLSSVAAFGKAGWLDDHATGLEKGRAANKPILVDFTGSDWCSWCIRLDKEVFAQPKFKEYASKNLILVEIDFPQLKPLPENKQQENEALAKKYGVEGFPTVIVLSPEGKKIGELGYGRGGPDAFIAKLEEFTKKRAN